MTPYTNAEAAEHLQNPEHMDGFGGNIWSGTHPSFNTDHGIPFTAVVDLQTGKVIATDPIPQLLSADDVLDAVQQAAEN